MSKTDMAQIPYIVHRKRMYEAYRRELRWRILFIATNSLWFIGLILWLIAR